MILPFLLGATAAGAFANRQRILKQVERAYATRFAPGADGVVSGAESFELRGTNGAGVLLLHGSGDSPRTMRFLAEQLNGRGYTIIAPVLAGHGRSPRSFAEATASDYLDSARSALRSLRDRHQSVFVGGLSMGGALAVRLAAEDAELAGLVLLAPYLVPPPAIQHIARLGWLWGLAFPYVQGRGESSVFDADASLESRAYGTYSPQALRALTETAREGMRVAGSLRMPILVVNSERDNRIPRECAERALGAFGSRPETHWVSGCGHVITIDYCKAEVARLVSSFLDRQARNHAPNPARISR